MASGLSGAFKIYNRINPHNKELMRKELQKIVDLPDISKNTLEIVSKILK